MQENMEIICIREIEYSNLYSIQQNLNIPIQNIELRRKEK